MNFNRLKQSELTEGTFSNWRESWQKPTFRIHLIAGIITLPIMLQLFSQFLNVMENREGVVLNDWLLNNLPSVDLSTPIFSVLWGCMALLIWQAVKSPKLFITYLWSFILLCITRVVTIWLVPLDPPKNMSLLIDPLVNEAFYGGAIITKDLFYSGHTATVLLAFLCFEMRLHKIFALIATFLTGIMLLFQHAHYTVDVVVVPLFTYAVYFITTRSLKKSL